MIVLSGGLPGRLPPEALRLYAASDDVHPLRGACRTAARIGVARCRIGAPAAPEAPADFLLWGDSHAEALLPAVEAAAIRAGKSGFATILTGCAPLLHVDRVDEGPPTRCSAYADAVMTFLPGRDDLPLVILSARWELAAEGTRSDEPSRVAVLVSRAHDLPVRPRRRQLRGVLSGDRRHRRRDRRHRPARGDPRQRAGNRLVRPGRPRPEPRPRPPGPRGAGHNRRRGAPRPLRRGLRGARLPAGSRLRPAGADPLHPGLAVTDAAGRPAYIDDDHMAGPAPRASSPVRSRRDLGEGDARRRAMRTAQPA